MDPIVVVDVKDKDTPVVGISGAAPIPSLHARESDRDSIVTLHHDGDLHNDSSNPWTNFGLTDYRCCYFKN